MKTSLGARRLGRALVACLCGTGALLVAGAAEPAERVEICHFPPGDHTAYETVLARARRVQRHLWHGDLMGPCSSHCSTLCDDGDRCTVDGEWDPDAQRCACASAPVVCTPLDQCHDAGVCDPAAGVCSDVPKPDGTSCDDDDADTGNDRCVSGACVGQTAQGASCREIHAANPSLPDGVYVLAGAPGPRLAYCDMTSDGGGWTALFVGHNGSPNVFDHFDVGSYEGTYDDPGTGRYLQRAPAPLGASASELAVSCGGAMVKFAMTEAVRDWLVLGTRSGWAPLTSTLVAGSVANLPNSVFTGTDIDGSFVFARDQGAGANTFASSYAGNSSFDSCNGAFDQASVVRIFYREGAPAPVHNTPETARRSCREILDARESAGDGVYWLVQSGQSPYQAYCDMTSDGGGWTAAFAGRNGSSNVFGHFDAPYQETCTDAATRCLRRAPGPIGDLQPELAVSCGPAMVKFPMTGAAFGWLSAGAWFNWVTLTPTVIRGSVPNAPNTLYTGHPSLASFVFARNQGTGANTFASSFAGGNAHDYCNGTPDAASLVRVLYRESSLPPVLNEPAHARPSCAALLDSGLSQGDGVYWLAEPGGPPYQAYCDMTTGGGGWTAVFTGRNGSTNVFGHFDEPGYVERCSYAATRCLRRAPPSLASASEMAVWCGDAAVKFPLTPPVRAWLQSGTRGDWISFVPTLLAGSVAAPPNSVFTGSSANQSVESFIFTRNQGAFANTFASSFDDGISYNYCNGVLDQASTVRIVYR